MKPIDLSDMEEEMALLEEAGLTDVDWEKVSTELAYFEAEAKIRKMDTISNLDPAKTALFLGMDIKPECTTHEEQEYRKLTHEMILKLLDMGITTILVEDSTLFGFLSIGELIRLRLKHDFSLMIIHRKSYTYQWLHIGDKEESHRRHLESVHYYAICDKLLGAVGQAEWIDICINHIAIAITENPPYYCNQRFATAAQWNALGCSDSQKVKEWLLREDERMMMFAKR